MIERQHAVCALDNVGVAPVVYSEEVHYQLLFPLTTGGQLRG